MKKKLLRVSLALVAGYMLLLGVFGIDALFNSSPPVQPQDSATVQYEEVTPDGLFLAINRVRVDNGLEPFSRNVLLDKSAGLKCENMAAEGYYEHANPTTGKLGGSYIADVGQYHNGASENLNQGEFVNSADVVASWMGSDAHAASILDPRYREVGFAVCVVNDLVTVVQHKIEPQLQQAVQQQNVRQYQPWPDYSVDTYQRPKKTYCTHNESEYFNDTTTCETY